METIAKRAHGARIAALAAALALAGCHDEPGVRYECRCSFLTDYDDGSGTTVVVCAPSPARASDVAKGCAQSAAPAPVETCACSASDDRASCRSGECVAR